MKKKCIVLAAFLILVSVQAIPKKKLAKLSLQDALILAVRADPQIQSQILQRVLDRFSFALAYNQYKPQYAFSALRSGADDQSSLQQVQATAQWKNLYGGELTAAIVHPQNKFTASYKQSWLRGNWSIQDFSLLDANNTVVAKSSALPIDNLLIKLAVVGKTIIKSAHLDNEI